MWSYRSCCSEWFVGFSGVVGVLSTTCPLMLKLNSTIFSIRHNSYLFAYCSHNVSFGIIHFNNACFPR